MASIYQHSDLHQRYDVGRSLPAPAIRVLMEILRRHVSRPIGLIVDLGSGTGRFSKALAEAFNASVVGVEPAPNMRAVAEAKLFPAMVKFVEGLAERIPLEDGVADLVFMSQVLHHILDRRTALHEIRRVLKPGRQLGIRQTTRENLDSFFYQRFFPEARAFDELRLPFRGDLVNLAQSCRYRLVALETVRHEIAATNFDYVEKTALRTYSDLECISDGAFHAGLRALGDYCAQHPDCPKFAENDLFVFARD
jgi:ubiquinone/menaquinone biosynthesis C-methylase UbiE